MSEDKREAILARLVVLAATIVPEANVYRNQIDIPEKQRPAMVILDGDEEADQSAYGRRRPANGPVIMAMDPEIFLLLGGDSETVGTRLNEYRALVVKAVLEDASLLALSHEGDIRFRGFTTGLAVGRSMEGEAGFGFTFNYVLRPNKL